MKYKGFEIRIIKDEYIEGGKLYSIYHQLIGWCVDYPSLDLAKDVIVLTNDLMIKCDYSLSYALMRAINIVG